MEARDIVAHQPEGKYQEPPPSCLKFSGIQLWLSDSGLALAWPGIDGSLVVWHRFVELSLSVFGLVFGIQPLANN